MSRKPKLAQAMNQIILSSTGNTYTDTWGRKNRKLADKACPHCGKVFRPLRESSRYCSRACMWANNGGQNRKQEVWWINTRGYVEGRIWLDEHTQVRIKRHRWLMEKHLGRRLLAHEDVHHKDENKLNNDMNNLELISHAGHTTLHNLARAAITKATNIPA